MEEKNDAPALAPVTLLTDMSPDDVHKNILRCFIVGNRVDRRLLDWLRVYVEMTYSVDLGISGAIPYVSKNLKCKRAEAYARI